MKERPDLALRASEQANLPSLVPALEQSIRRVNGEGEEPETKNLAQKIREIQNSVGIVKKRGQHPQGWKYLMIEDAVTAVNKLMVEQNLILTGTLARKPTQEFDVTRTNHHDKGYMTDLVMEWTLEDVGTGEKRTYYTPGTGFDSTDKGIYKAETGSRKYTIINIFNLPVGDNPEQSPAADRETAKANAKDVASKKLAEAASRGNQTAIDALSQIEPEKKIFISRPEEMNGHYIAVKGFIAVPQLERFFMDVNAKRAQTKTPPIIPWWKVAAEYEKGLLALCEKLGIEVEG